MYKSKPNVQSPQSLALKYMREKRQLTLLNVGKNIGMKPKDIDHIENGRRVVTDTEILLLLKCYNYSIEIFNEMIKITPLTKQASNHYFLTRT